MAQDHDDEISHGLRGCETSVWRLHGTIEPLTRHLMFASLLLLAGCARCAIPAIGGARDAGTAADAGPIQDAGGLIDAGPAADAGSHFDAGPGADAGAHIDAGPGADAGAHIDAGPTADAGPDAGSVIALGGDSVFMHHRNPNRDGLYIQPTLTKAAIGTLHRETAFAPTNIVGDVYAQPLFVDGQGGTDLVIVVTENNNVYALNAASGAQVWSMSVGTPVPLATLATCGNIDPFGITGTPVIDPQTRTLFLDAELIPTGGAPTHRVFALSVDDGSIRAGWPVDVPTVAVSGSSTFTSNVQGQRGALAVLNGTVYIPFGGRYGDCGSYRGWVVGVSVSNPSHVTSWATSALGGGAWSPSGIATDGTDLFVSTGNTFSTSQVWGGGDAFISLAPGATLGMNGYFAPKNWFLLDNADLDMGTAPIVFDLPGSTPSALAIMFGKDANAYLIDRTTPGGVGVALGGSASGCTATNTTGLCSTLAGVATQEIISAPTLYTTATATYIAVKGNGNHCTGGTSGNLVTVKVVPGAPPTLAASWCGAGGNGSPMVTTSDGHADAIVWTLGAESDNFLHAFDGDTGAPVAFTDSAKAFPGMRRYNTPIAAKGRIYVPVDGAHGGVIAFGL